MEVRNLKVYISGPMTGNKNYKEHFGSMSYLLKKSGHKPINPVHIMDSVRGILDYKTILNADLELLEGCDAILFMSGWDNSKGCKKEYDKAERLKLKMFFASGLTLPEGLQNE